MKNLTICSLLILAAAVATAAIAADITYEYDELGRLVRVFDPAGQEITYQYDAAGNITQRTVGTDLDLDGVPDSLDCAPADASVFGGAPEINDGIDNQCPGDDGYGLVDEIESRIVFTDATTLTWLDQPGATTYEVAWSDIVDFSKNCSQRYEIAPTHTATAVPATGEIYFYLVRAVQPNAGSWGRGDGVERTVSCATP